MIIYCVISPTRLRDRAVPYDCHREAADRLNGIANCVSGKRAILNDSDLLGKLRNQDLEAIRSLTRSYLPSIWRFVYVRVKGDEHLAEDIVSETVVALIKAAKEEADIGNPVAWMRSVAQNKVVDHFRSAARVRELMQNITQTTDGADHEDATSLQLAQERIGQVREVMDGLTEQYRLALEWKYLEKLSVREISERFATTEKAAESILFRARREFRDRHADLQKKVDSPPIVIRPPKPKTAAVDHRQPDTPETVMESSGNHHSANLNH
jgi:RNA polymerase sigma-70 factor, ECF subfamily